MFAEDDAAKRIYVRSNQMDAVRSLLTPVAYAAQTTLKVLHPTALFEPATDTTSFSQENVDES